MYQEASVTGLIRTIFIIIGIIAALRFIGQILMAKRERDKLNELDKNNRAQSEAKLKAEKEKGRITLMKDKGDDNTEDVEFDEL